MAEIQPEINVIRQSTRVHHTISVGDGKIVIFKFCYAGAWGESEIKICAPDFVSIAKAETIVQCIQRAVVEANSLDKEFPPGSKK